MALVFEKRVLLPVNQQGDRRQGSNLSLNLRFGQTCMSLGRRLGCASAVLWAGFDWRAWNLAVYGQVW